MALNSVPGYIIPLTTSSEIFWPYSLELVFVVRQFSTTKSPLPTIINFLGLLWEVPMYEILKGSVNYLPFKTEYFEI